MSPCFRPGTLDHSEGSAHPRTTAGGFLSIARDIEASRLGAGAGASHEAPQRQHGIRWVSLPFGHDGCPARQVRHAVHSDGGVGGHGWSLRGVAAAANNADNHTDNRVREFWDG